MDIVTAIGRGLGEAGARALDLAFPARCAGCGREGHAICPDCLPDLERRIGAPPGVELGLPGDIPPPLLQAEWCAQFSGVARRAIHRLKYGGDRRLAVPLGRVIGRRWAWAGRGGDAFVPVPASPDRVRERGYDQAALLATVAAREAGIPAWPILERTRTTTAQFDLDRGERDANVRGAFRVAEAAPALAGRWLVLVDDVHTTGSTLAACAEALLDAGALAISAITVARER